MIAPKGGIVAPLLVTGASGFIGRRVAALAVVRGLAVLAPPRAMLDWTDQASARGYLLKYRPRTIIHLASSGVFARDPHDPALVANECTMIDNILDSAPEGCRIIGGGSMAEYGQSGRLAEVFPCRPNNAYARAKHEAGLRLLKRLEGGGISGCHARIFGAFGAGEAASRLLPLVVKSLRQGEAVALSDGLQKRDFVHVDDVANALLALAASPTLTEPLVNVGTGEAMTMRSAVERVADELGASHGLLRFGEIDRAPNDQDVLEAETTRLRAAIGWVPTQHFNRPEPIMSLL